MSGVVLTEARIGQAASEAGLLKGDIVESLFTVNTRTQSDLFKAMEGVNAGDKIPFVVKRAVSNTPAATPTASATTSVKPQTVRKTIIVEVGGVGYTREQIQSIRRLAHRSDADFEVSLNPTLSTNLNALLPASTSTSASLYTNGNATPSASSSLTTPPVVSGGNNAFGFNTKK